VFVKTRIGSNKFMTGVLQLAQGRRFEQKKLVIKVQHNEFKSILTKSCRRIVSGGKRAKRVELVGTTGFPGAFVYYLTKNTDYR
jgi:hypothetical protein